MALTNLMLWEFATTVAQLLLYNRTTSSQESGLQTDVMSHPPALGPGLHPAQGSSRIMVNNPSHISASPRSQMLALVDLAPKDFNSTAYELYVMDLFPSKFEVILLMAQKQMPIPQQVLQKVCKSKDTKQFMQLFDIFATTDQIRIDLTAIGSDYFEPFGFPHVTHVLNRDQLAVLHVFKFVNLPDLSRIFALSIAAIEMCVLAGHVQKVQFLMDRINCKVSDLAFIEAVFMEDRMSEFKHWVVKQCWEQKLLTLKDLIFMSASEHVTSTTYNLIKLMEQLQEAESMALDLAGEIYRTGQAELLIPLMQLKNFKSTWFPYRELSAVPLYLHTRDHFRWQVMQHVSFWNSKQCLFIIPLLRTHYFLSSLNDVLKQLLVSEHDFEDLAVASLYGLTEMTGLLNEKSATYRTDAVQLTYLAVHFALKAEQLQDWCDADEEHCVSEQLPYVSEMVEENAVVLFLLQMGVDLLQVYLLAMSLCDVIAMYEISCLPSFPMERLKRMDLGIWLHFQSVLFRDIYDTTIRRIEYFQMRALDMDHLISVVRSCAGISPAAFDVLKAYADLFFDDRLSRALETQRLDTDRDY